MLTCSDTGISSLTVSQLIEAIFHDSMHCTYYLYDSHSRDDFGNLSSNGASVLVSFKIQVEVCLIHLQKTYVNRLFKIATSVNQR